MTAAAQRLERAVKLGNELSEMRRALVRFQQQVEDLNRAMREELILARQEVLDEQEAQHVPALANVNRRQVGA